MLTTSQIIYLDSAHDVDSGCKAKLIVAPKVYLGWTPDLQQEHVSTHFNRDGMTEIIANQETLSHHIIGGAKQLAGKLEKMFFLEEVRSVVRFEEIVRGCRKRRV